MGELQRTGQHSQEIEEFFEGMEKYMQKYRLVKVPGPRQVRPVVRRKPRHKFPRVRVSNRSMPRVSA